jgi:hypothetical protein
MMLHKPPPLDVHRPMFCPSMPPPASLPHHLIAQPAVGPRAGPLTTLLLPPTRSASDLYGLQVWGPKLTGIELAMCYGMRVLRLLGSEGPQVQVSFPDTELDPDSQQHLREHPRVGPDNVMADWPEG